MDVTRASTNPIKDLGEKSGEEFLLKPKFKVDSKLATFGEEVEEFECVTTEQLEPVASEGSGLMASKNIHKRGHRRDRVFHVWTGPIKLETQREEVNSAPTGGVTPPPQEYRRSQSVDFGVRRITEEDVEEECLSPPPGYCPKQSINFGSMRITEVIEEMEDEEIEVLEDMEVVKEKPNSPPPGFLPPPSFEEAMRFANPSRGVKGFNLGSKRRTSGAFGGVGKSFTFGKVEKMRECVEGNVFAGLSSGSLIKSQVVLGKAKLVDSAPASYSFFPEDRELLRARIESTGLMDSGAALLEGILFRTFNQDLPEIHVSENCKKISIEISTSKKNHWGTVYNKMSKENLAVSRIFAIFNVSVNFKTKEEDSQEIVFTFKPGINLNTRLLLAKNNDPSLHLQGSAKAKKKMTSRPSFVQSPSSSPRMEASLVVEPVKEPTHKHDPLGLSPRMQAMLDVEPKEPEVIVNIGEDEEDKVLECDYSSTTKF